MWQVRVNKLSEFRVENCLHCRIYEVDLAHHNSEPIDSFYALLAILLYEFVCLSDSTPAFLVLADAFQELMHRLPMLW